MKITVITGSPHRKGTSALLADEFIRGAKEAGHEVFRFDSAFEQVHPCIGCDKCGIGAAPCVQKDEMQKLNPHMLEADLVVLVTPLYYFGFSAQIKTVIDRFYANSYNFTGNKKSILLATCYDSSERAMHALTESYKAISEYMRWEDAGTILATNCGTRCAIEHSSFPEQAYRMGRAI